MDGGWNPAGRGDLQRGDRLRLAAGQPRQPGGDRCQYDLHRLLPRAQRPLRRHQRLLRHRRLRQRAAARARRRGRRAERRLQVRAIRRLFRPGPDTFQSSNYWVDVVFENTVGPDTTPPTITARSPAERRQRGLDGRQRHRDLQRADGPATINGTNIQLRDPSNALVPATVTYSGANRRATLDPGCRPAELDHLHGDGEGRARWRHRRREPRQRPRLRLDLVLHHRGASAAAARRGPRRPHPGDLECRQPVQPLLRRDPARRGTERIHRDRHLQRHAGDPERARRRDPRRRTAEPRPGPDAERLGAGWGQPDREPARSAAGRPARTDARRFASVQ